MVPQFFMPATPMDYHKYPRTPHLPWSPGATSDDRTLPDVSHFIGQQVVVTEKMDGENTSCYTRHLHARSIDSAHHPSRDWLKGFWASFAWRIPEGWRICGENLWAVHSIPYSQLESYFLVFSVWDENNRALDWDSTQAFCQELGLKTVPVLYCGEFDEKHIRGLYTENRLPDQMEGYVVRKAGAFSYDEFDRHLAKFVRKDHVQTDQHWMHSALQKNRLRP